MDAAERSTSHGEILAKGRDGPAVDVADASDHAVPGHGFPFQSEMVAVVLRVQAPLHEGVLLEEGVEAVARGHQTLLAALRQFVFAARGIGRTALEIQIRE